MDVRDQLVRCGAEGVDDDDEEDETERDLFDQSKESFLHKYITIIIIMNF